MRMNRWVWTGWIASSAWVVGLYLYTLKRILLQDLLADLIPPHCRSVTIYPASGFQLPAQQPASEGLMAARGQVHSL